MTSQNLTGTQVGDKIRIRIGERAGQRGIVEAVCETSLLVGLDSGETINVPLEEITNYSLAARRAWEVMPKRAGRPVSALPQKKMISIRLDSQVWELLGSAVELGLIPSREQAINTWLRQHADELVGQVVDREQQLLEEGNA